MVVAFWKICHTIYETRGLWRPFVDSLGVGELKIKNLCLIYCTWHFSCIAFFDLHNSSSTLILHESWGLCFIQGFVWVCLISKPVLLLHKTILVFEIQKLFLCVKREKSCLLRNPYCETELWSLTNGAKIYALPLTNYIVLGELTSLCLCFFICKLEIIIIVHVLWGCY